MHPHIDAGIEKALKLRYFRNKTPLGDPPEQVELVGKWFNLTRVNMEIDDSRFVPLDDFRKKVFDEVLEFFSIVIPDGAFTSQLQHLEVGDELLLNTMPFGFLTLARYQKPLPKDLWLLATGTGLAPFLSMLQDLKTWEDYEHIILAYSARSTEELAYIDKIESLQEDFGSLVDNPAKLVFIPIVTREAVEGALTERLPKLLLDGTLQERAGIALDVDSTHVMLCGNPEMVEDTKEMLKSLGLVMNRRGEGNIAVENYW